MRKTKGALEGSRRVEGERARERLEFMRNLMASDSLQVPPPSRSLTAPEEEGATSRVGFMIIEKTKRKRERERGKACVFPRHTSSCETMIYAFLRTLGSQNVTFNQAH